MKKPEYFPKPPDTFNTRLQEIKQNQEMLNLARQIESGQGTQENVGTLLLYVIKNLNKEI